VVVVVKDDFIFVFFFILAVVITKLRGVEVGHTARVTNSVLRVELPSAE
jgi:hypothetical protein